MAVIAVEQHNGVRGGGPDGTRLDVNVPARGARHVMYGVLRMGWTKLGGGIRCISIAP